MVRVFPDQIVLMEELQRLLHAAAVANSTVDALEGQLKATNISEEHLAVALMFWKTERPKVLRLLRCAFFCSPGRLVWRVVAVVAVGGWLSTH